MACLPPVAVIMQLAHAELPVSVHSGVLIPDTAAFVPGMFCVCKARGEMEEHLQQTVLIPAGVFPRPGARLWFALVLQQRAVMLRGAAA